MLFAVRALSIVLALSGCVETATIPCGEGRCPANTACDVVHGRCVAPAQLEVCVGLADGRSCDLTGGAVGICLDEVCLDPTCGDGQVDGSEDCDGDILPATDCMQLGYYTSAPLTCGDDCNYNVSACGAICGDGIRDEGFEACDETDLGGVTDCTALGYYFSGPLSCNQLCQFNDTACTGYCGDQVVNDASETCDGSPPVVAACTSFGYDAGPIECSGFCTPGLGACAQIGWTQIEGFGNVNLRSVWVADASTAFAVGDAGVGKRSAGTWSAQSVPGNKPYRAIHGTSPSNVIAVGDQGVIAHYDGTTWSAQPSGVVAHLEAVFVLTPSEAYAVGDDGTVLRWNGTLWSLLPAGTLEGLNAVWAASANAVFVATEGGSMLRFDGSVWSSTFIGGYVFGLLGFGADDVVAIGSNVAKRFDGTTWTDLPKPPSADYHGLWGTSRSDLFAVSGAGQISHYDGTSWSRVVTTTNRAIYAIHGSGPGDILAVGSNGLVLRYEGAQWVTPAVPDEINTGAWGSNIADVFLGHASGVLHFDGTSWTPMFAPGASTLVHAVWGLEPRAVWATNEAGQVLHYNGTWSVQAKPSNAGLRAIWGSSDDNIYAVGYGGLTRYNGLSWSTLTSPTGSSLRAVWGTGPRDVFAVGDGGKITHNDGTGWTTQVSELGVVFRGVWGSGPRDVFAVGEGGVIMHYDGTSWMRQSSTTTVTLEAVHGSGPGDVFAVGVDGVVLHYDGARWSPVATQTTASLRAVWTTPRFTVLGGQSGVLRLDRTVPWVCSPSEVSCGDSVDNDCDGRIDNADADCKAALRLSEVHGGTPAYVEIINRAATTANLDGISLTMRGSCDDAPDSYRFPPDAIVGPGEVYRALTTTSGLQARERPLVNGFCHSAAAGGGWYALCAGACDLATCSNVIDYVEVGAAVGPPACVSFTPSPVVVTGATATQSAIRTAFTGTGVMADWTLGTATRD